MTETLDLFLSESNHIEEEYSQEAFDDAKRAWEFLCTFKNIDEKILCATHKILLYRLFPEIAGKLRTVNVRVGKHVCPPYDAVPRLLNAWMMNWGRAETPSQILNAHIRFEGIHPFQDGNGRIGRIIMNWQRKKVGLPLEVILAEERGKYYKLFR